MKTTNAYSARDIITTIAFCALPMGSPQAQDLTNGWYRLKTVADLDKACLEGNQAGSSHLNGAAFMDECKNASGQFWKFVPAANGAYRLKNQFRGDGECLEGNQAKSPVHNGAAFMDKCQNVSGQLWEVVVPEGVVTPPTVYQLKTKFRGPGECLQGDYGPGLNAHFEHGGNAYMNECSLRTDRSWTIELVSGSEDRDQESLDSDQAYQDRYQSMREPGSDFLSPQGTSEVSASSPSPDHYYRLSTQFRGPNMNLDVHNGGEKNNMTQLAPRGDYSGQYWRFTPTGNGYYRLTTMFRGENTCLDVYNGGPRNDQVQLTGCGNYSGQFWKLRNDNGWLRLTTQFRGPEMCLDIFNGGPDDNQPHLTNCANFSGQFWKLEETTKQTGNSYGATNQESADEPDFRVPPAMENDGDSADSDAPPTQLTAAMLQGKWTESNNCSGDFTTFQGNGKFANSSGGSGSWMLSGNHLTLYVNAEGSSPFNMAPPVFANLQPTSYDEIQVTSGGQSSVMRRCR